MCTWWICFGVLIRKHAVRVTVMVMSMVSTDFDGAVFGVVQLQGRMPTYAATG